MVFRTALLTASKRMAMVAATKVGGKLVAGAMGHECRSSGAFRFLVYFAPYGADGAARFCFPPVCILSGPDGMK